MKKKNFAKYSTKTLNKSNICLSNMFFLMPFYSLLFQRIVASIMQICLRMTMEICDLIELSFCAVYIDSIYFVYELAKKELN